MDERVRGCSGKVELGAFGRRLVWMNASVDSNDGCSSMRWRRDRCRLSCRWRRRSEVVVVAFADIVHVDLIFGIAIIVVAIDTELFSGHERKAMRRMGALRVAERQAGSDSESTHQLELIHFAECSRMRQT